MKNSFAYDIAHGIWLTLLGRLDCDEETKKDLAGKEEPKGNVYIAEGAEFDGKIITPELLIEKGGKVSGEVEAGKVLMKSGSRVSAIVRAKDIIVEAGVNLEGSNLIS